MFATSAPTAHSACGRLSNWNQVIEELGDGAPDGQPPTGTRSEFDGTLGTA
jgi:hypothetical protein